MAASKPYASLDIRGQCVLITGASAGIGEACAWRFAEAGCRLVLLARRQVRLDTLKQALEKQYQVPIHTAQLDVQDSAAVEHLPSQLPADFAQVDILINNAGLALGLASVLDNDMHDWHTMIETNVTSVILLTKLFVKGMVDRNRGHIINISSTAGKQSYAGGSMYCATKHAIEAFTTGIREDLLATNVRVTTVSPGAVNTEFSTVRFKGNVTRADAVYEGMLALVAPDIADNVIYAATRPIHVQIGDILVTSVHQCGTKIARPLLEADES